VTLTEDEDVTVVLPVTENPLDIVPVFASGVDDSEMTRDRVGVALGEWVRDCGNDVEGESLPETVPLGVRLVDTLFDAENDRDVGRLYVADAFTDAESDRVRDAVVVGDAVGESVRDRVSDQDADSDTDGVTELLGASDRVAVSSFVIVLLPVSVAVGVLVRVLDGLSVCESVSVNDMLCNCDGDIVFVAVVLKDLLNVADAELESDMLVSVDGLRVALAHRESVADFSGVSVRDCDRVNVCDRC